MRRIKVFLLICTLAFAFWFVPFVPAFVIGTINQTRYIYSTSTSFQKLVGPGHSGWTPISTVSKNVVAAFICAEDANFYNHSGLDFEAIKKSWQHNQKKKKIRGGSTITQQVVKVGLLSYERSYIRKIREALGAIILEQIRSKDEILEWYINMVEFGDGIYGIEEASKAYFKIKPEKLTIAQAINLALVLPAPNKWSKGLKNKSLTVFNQKRFKFILRQMLLGGYITRAQWEQSMASGNFGRPIIGYREEVNVLSKEEASELDPIIEIDDSDLEERPSPASDIMENGAPNTNNGNLKVERPDHLGDVPEEETSESNPNRENIEQDKVMPIDSDHSLSTGGDPKVGEPTSTHQDDRVNQSRDGRDSENQNQNAPDGEFKED